MKKIERIINIDDISNRINLTVEPNSKSESIYYVVKNYNDNVEFYNMQHYYLKDEKKIDIIVYDNTLYACINSFTKTEWLNDYTNVISLSDLFNSYIAKNLNVNMDNMFDGCEKVNKIDISFFDLNQNKNRMNNIFKGCNSTLEITVATERDVEAVRLNSSIPQGTIIIKNKITT